MFHETAVEFALGISRRFAPAVYGHLLARFMRILQAEACATYLYFGFSGSSLRKKDCYCSLFFNRSIANRRFRFNYEPLIDSSYTLIYSHVV